MHRKSAFAVALSILAALAVACGSDKDEGGNTGGGSSTGGSGNSGGSSTSGGNGSGTCTTDIPAPTMSNADACKAFCAKEEACMEGTSVADCIGYRDCDNQDVGSPACVAANKAFWTCLNAQTGAICKAEECCASQSDAAFEACM